MVKKIPFPTTEEPDEQLKTVKALKKRHPDWLFDMCSICNTWCVVRKEWNGLHLLCYEKNKTKYKKVPDKNQETLL